jgi:dihydrofolate reductase
MILAMDKNNLVGKGNDLPWYYPEDLKYFKQVTLNKDVLMGYNTYLSIVNRLGKPLPKRVNYVLTYAKELPFGGIVVDDLEEFLKKYESSEEELFIIGGKSVYESLASRAQRIYLTRINEEHDGNLYLNCFDFSKYNLISQDIQGVLSFEIYELK